MAAAATGSGRPAYRYGRCGGADGGSGSARPVLKTTRIDPQWHGHHEGTERATHDRERKVRK